MLNLPVYAREGIYYFHTRVGGKQIKRSLATRNKVIAIIKASKIMEALMKIDLSGIRTYEIDLKNGLLRSEGADDHERMLEALGVLTAHQQPVAQPAENRNLLTKKQKMTGEGVTIPRSIRETASGPISRASAT